MAKDEFEDDEWTEDDENGVNLATMLANDPLIKTVPLEKPKTPEKRSQEAWLAEKDIPLWTEPLPDTKSQAQFWGNMAHKILRGITRAEIKKLSVKDRVASAAVCFDKMQLSLDKPTANINFEMRRSMPELAAKLHEELARRQRERATINITPTEGDE